MGDHFDENRDGVADHDEHPVASTAGEQDHSDPWWYAEDDCDPPVSTSEDAASPGGDH